MRLQVRIVSQPFTAVAQRLMGKALSWAMAGVLIMSGAFYALPAADNSAALKQYEQEIVPLLQAYCYDCHGTEKQKGDLNLASYKTGVAANKVRKVWKEVSHQLTAKEMPPEKERKQPSDAERKLLVTWIKSLSENDAPDPGRVTVRRLNRFEYNNTIRDLFGFDMKPGDDFPDDDVGHGFDNIGDVLSLPPLLMEKYLIAADQILDKAIVIEQPSFDINLADWTMVVDGKESGKAPAVSEKKDDGVQLINASELRGMIALPVGGKYTVKVRVGAEQAGTEPAMMGIKIDDKMVIDTRVLAKRPAVLSLTIDAPRGLHAVSVVFMNPFKEAPIEITKDMKLPPGKKPPEPRTRSLSLVSMELKGPRVTVPPSHKAIFSIRPDPKNKDSAAAERDAAKAIVTNFSSKAFRRPVTPVQLDRLMNLYDTAKKNGQVYEECVRFVLKGILVSPSFIFRAEPDRPTKDPHGVYPLDDYEIASRLSYFLWSSMPDDALFAQAKAEKLRDPSVITSEVQRMLKDPKSKALVQGFASQWLELRKLETITFDAKTFPEFNEDIRKAMYEETALYFESIMREDRSVLEFIDSDYAYLNDKLAKLYNISGVNGPQMRRVSLTDRNRGGLLGQGAILAVTSMPNRTSPVKRGKWVLEQLLGDPPPPPPPMVESLEQEAENKKEVLLLSLRERMDLHRQDPVCNSCHKVMDAIGFGLENFDALGRWREKDGKGAQLDTAGKLPSGSSFRSPSELKRLFMNDKEKFAFNLAEKMMTYALGRGMEHYDDQTLEKIALELDKNDYRFSLLVTQIATSYPFLYRRNH
jgi:mono/diheme cytochrome c family protein